MSTPSINVLDLQCFVAIVETGSFAAAGRHLGLSTSGVSKMIARLETGKGVRLLNRSTHSLSLTPEGEALIGIAREAAAIMDRVDSVFASAAQEGMAGRVRIGAPTAFLRACLAPMLPAFQAAHPDIVLDLRGSDEVADLAGGGLDLVLRTGATDGVPGHLQRTLLTFGWVACASPTYLGHRPVITKPEDLADHLCIGFRNQRTGLVDPWRFREPDAGKMLRWMPRPAVVLDDANAVVRAAIAGAGVTWAPDWLVSDAIKSGVLIPILADCATDPMTMSILRRRNSRDPKRIDQVLAFLKARFTPSSGD